MTITPLLFETYLKCPTKCWLRFTNEPPSGNAYAEWVQTETESYHTATAKRLTANLPVDECASFCSSRREEAHYDSPEALKTAKWQFAVDIPASIELGSSRGNEAQTSPSENSQSLLTSAATIETCLQAIERIPSAGRGQPAQFVPIRFIYRNKLTKDDKLPLAFDAFVLSEMLGRAVSLGKIIHGDLRDCARSSRGNEAQISSPALEVSIGGQSLLTSAATTQADTQSGIDEPQTGIAATLGQAQPRVTKVKTSALAGEVRKRLGKITALLASPAPPDLVLNRHCAECEFQARCRKLAVEKDEPQPAGRHEREGAPETSQQRHLYRHATLLHVPPAPPAQAAARQTREISSRAQGSGDSGAKNPHRRQRGTQGRRHARLSGCRGIICDCNRQCLELDTRGG